MYIKNRKRSILFGAAYYDEYIPSSDLEHDFSLMQEAGFSVIRVGEGSWSKWEPEDGIFNLDWLRPVLDKASEKGISVIIGMPTFSLPRWMVRKYPELALGELTGFPKKFGYREEHNYSHPAYKHFSRRIIEKIVNYYREHSAVIGWQVYNEPGLFINYSHDQFEGFKDFLRRKYVTVDNLNKKWGLVFWSHELSTWDDLWAPEGNGSPQYDYEWRCYQQEQTSEMVTWTQNEIRRYARPDQFTTACIAASRVAVDEGRVCDSLDVAAANIYYQMQDGFQTDNRALLPKTAFQSGAWSVAYHSDRGYAMKQSPFYVFETNGGAIGGAADNFPAWNGQWRQAAYQMIARGAGMIEYWHWQALHYGTETYWGGILPHDRKPGRVYEQIAALGNELSMLDEELVSLKPDSDVVFLYSEKSRSALSVQPHRADDTQSPHRQKNEKSYDEILQAFYQGAYQANRQVSIVHDTKLIDDSNGQWRVDPGIFVRNNPVLVVAGLYCSTRSFRDWLSAYIVAGGHLILGPKSLYANEHACPLQERKPALGVELTGCFYQEYSNLASPLIVKPENDFPVSGLAEARDWIECLVPAGGDVLAKVNHPHFSQFALMVTHKLSTGRVTTVGTVPSERLAADLFLWAVPEVVAPETCSQGITVSSAVNSHGKRLFFIFNWSWEEKNIQLPAGFIRIDKGHRNLLSNTLLSAWDIQIFRAGE